MSSMMKWTAVKDAVTEIEDALISADDETGALEYVSKAASSAAYAADGEPGFASHFRHDWWEATRLVADREAVLRVNRMLRRPAREF